MARTVSLLKVLTAAVALHAPAWSGRAVPDDALPDATEEQAAAQSSEEKSALSIPEAELTPEEKAEREGRKACKVALCAAFRNKQPGPDISCHITKSLRKSQLEKLVSKAKVSWPWGRVVCTADVNVKRETILKSMTEDKTEAVFDKHQVNCTVERDKQEPATITAEMSPKVSFEKGKAVKASVNWGKVSGPALIKGAMWTATATDNTLNVLGSTLVEDVNSFVTDRCEEVKEEWAGK